MTFNNKTILITGASTGIGKAVAQKLFQKNCNLVLIARRDDLITEYVNDVDNLEAKVNLATIYIKEQNFSLAKEQIEEILAIDPDYSKAHNALGTIAIHEEMFDEALIHFKKASEFKPVSSDVYYNLGITLLQLERIDEAIIELKKAIEANPQDPKPSFSLGAAYY